MVGMSYELVCEWCAGEFVQVRPSRFCSKSCRDRERHQRRAPRWAEGGSGSIPGRARLIRELRERDGDVCQLCDGVEGPVKFGRHPSRTVRDPLTVSLDHILPRSRGGTHDVWNLQIAHFVCNARKGARVEGIVGPVHGPPRPKRPKPHVSESEYAPPLGISDDVDTFRIVRASRAARERVNRGARPSYTYRAGGQVFTVTY